MFESGGKPTALQTLRDGGRMAVIDRRYRGSVPGDLAVERDERGRPLELLVQLDPKLPISGELRCAGTLGAISNFAFPRLGADGEKKTIVSYHDSQGGFGRNDRYFKDTKPGTNCSGSRRDTNCDLQ
jgi:hypothetical protein